MSDENWGEQRVVARKRRLGVIRGAMIVAAVAFGLFAKRLIPDGPDADAIKLAAGTVYALAILFGGWLIWRRTDEVERRLAVNFFAAAGFAMLFLGVLVMLAAPVFGIDRPLTIVWAGSLAIGGLVWLVQRLRG